MKTKKNKKPSPNPKLKEVIDMLDDVPLDIEYIDENSAVFGIGIMEVCGGDREKVHIDFYLGTPYAQVAEVMKPLANIEGIEVGEDATYIRTVLDDDDKIKDIQAYYDDEAFVEYGKDLLSVAICKCCIEKMFSNEERQTNNEQKNSKKEDMH